MFNNKCYIKSFLGFLLFIICFSTKATGVPPPDLPPAGYTGANVAATAAAATKKNNCTVVNAAANPELAQKRSPRCEAQDMSDIFSEMFDDPATSPLSSSSGIYKIAIFFWSIFVYISLVILLIKYVFGQAKVHDAINTIILWIFTGALIHYFNDVTNMIIDASQAMRAVVQISLYKAAGYTGPTDDIITDTFFVPKVLWSIFSSLYFEEPDIFKIIRLIVNIVFFFILSLVYLVLALVGILLSFWVNFGIYLAKILGLYYVPFLMFKKTASYFDSWVKFFIGYVIFGMISQILLTLCLVLILKYLTALGSVGGGAPIEMNAVMSGGGTSAKQLNMTGIGWQQMASMLGMALIGLVAIASTSKIVSKLTGGIGGGLGDAISSTISTASKLAGNIK